MQEELEVVTRQLRQTEQDSKALVSTQLAEAEAAWKDALEDSQQRLQDALHKIAVSMAPAPIVPVSCHSQLDGVRGHALNRV